MMKLIQIKKNPKNPRVIKDERFMELVESLRKFPKMLKYRPIITDNDWGVLGGNMRLEALKYLGYKEIPDEWVRKASDLTAEERRQFIVKDNVNFGDWDWDLLNEEYDEDELLSMGFEFIDKKKTEPEAHDDNYEEPESVDVFINEGDLVEIGDHRLICGSSTDNEVWLKLMQGNKLDLMVTDPPYNVDYVGKTEAKLKIKNDRMNDEQFYHFLLDFHTIGMNHTKDGGAWYVWHAESEGINFRLAFADSGLMIKQCLIWVKNTMVLGRQDYQWKHEPCLYGWKPGAAHHFTDARNKVTVTESENVNFNKLTKKELVKILTEMQTRDEYVTIIRENKPSKSRLHPTMKPVGLLAPLIKNSSEIGEIVGDGFIGSGATMVTSHQLGRRCYAIELDPKYIQVTIHRMIRLDPKLSVRINGEQMTPEQMENLVNE